MSYNVLIGVLLQVSTTSQKAFLAASNFHLYVAEKLSYYSKTRLFRVFPASLPLTMMPI